MPGPNSLACPKPEPLRRTRARKARADAKRLRVWRDAIWRREAEKFLDCESNPLVYGEEWARCQHCLVAVHRSPTELTGECHHRIGRRAKASRYDPNNGVLLCAGPGTNNCHSKAQRHEI